MRREMLARSFVNELALFRKLLGRASIVRQDLKTGYGRLLQVFDATAPGVVEVRDTLAHLDERVLAESRGKKFALAPNSQGGTTLTLGLRLSGSCLGGHVFDGTYVEIALTSGTLQKCAEILWDAYGLYPAKPGLQEAMENSKRTVGNIKVY